MPHHAADDQPGPTRPIHGFAETRRSSSPTGCRPPRDAPSTAPSIRRHPSWYPLPSGEQGQTTAEYALVLVGAATIAMLVVAWAGSTSRISALFDAVLRSVQSMIG